MISTALAIQEATRDAVHDEEVMGMASAIFHHRNEMNDEDFAKAIYMYSAHLSAMTATLVTHACLTESQLRDMLDTIKEMEAMGKDIDNGNN
jgi:metal-responsive CopG/Arc/MetJ family transcriptional regulator